MAVFIDPKSGERYENVPDDAAESAQSKFGLVPESQYASDQAYEAKPLGEKALETGRAALEGAARPLEAASELATSAGLVRDPNANPYVSAETNEASRLEASPSSPEALERKQRHPIAGSLGQLAVEAPLAAVGGIPGAAVRVGSAALLGSAESSFEQGNGYVPNARDGLTYGALQAAFEGAAGVGGLVSRYLRSNRPALEQAAERAERFAATARSEGDAAVKAERYAAEAPLHFDRLSKEGAEAVDGMSRAVVDVDQALTGLKVEAKETAALGAAADVRNALKAELDAIKPLPSPARGAVTEVPQVPGQAEAGQRALAEIRASLGLGEKPVPVPAYAQATPKSSLEANAGRRPGAGKKLSEMTPEAAAEARSNLEQQAAIGRKTPFSAKKATGGVAETRQTMARVLDLIDDTEPKNLYTVLRDSRNALSGLEGSAQSVQVIDEALSRVDVFGKAAEAYTAATSAGVLRAREAWESVARELAPGGAVDAKALRKFVEDPVASASLRGDIQTALEGLDSSVDLLRRGGKPAVLKQAQQAAATLRGVLDEADEVVGAVRAQKLSGKAQKGLYGALSRAVAGKAARVGAAAIGGAIGGPVGAGATYLASEALEGPAVALMARMNVYRARDIGHTARAMVYRAAPGAERAASAAARVLPSAGLGASAAYNAFVSDYDSPREAYAASIKAVNVAPEQLAASLGISLEGVPDEAREAINLKAFQTQEFLKSKMPAGVGVSLMNPEGIPASRYSVSKWSLYYTAAMNPSTVYADLAAGRAQIEQIETLKALHEDDYNDLRDEAIRLVTTGARPSIKQRARMHLLFGIGAEVDPFFSQSLPAMIDNARKTLAAKPKPQVNVPQSNSGAASRFASPQRTLETVQ